VQHRRQQGEAQRKIMASGGAFERADPIAQSGARGGIPWPPALVPVQ
jgi:hypothetical protein